VWEVTFHLVGCQTLVLSSSTSSLWERKEVIKAVSGELGDHYKGLKGFEECEEVSSGG
jgi:hypothetical protein